MSIKFCFRYFFFNFDVWLVFFVSSLVLLGVSFLVLFVLLIVVVLVGLGFRGLEKEMVYELVCLEVKGIFGIFWLWFFFSWWIGVLLGG